ncbi:NADH-quinone oxidoreductase subunit 5 family protein [Actinomadura rupiterrae]|uniref:NADH-quinone oxidoreductase subunit 5 family protein n=1 Tax=Actinomadura rupiterrae TaxID=559627 RepID=UPI0020A4EC37|nr:proton-conducting transporter membrane subunit [Actinomadura rupiterrae]MCP2343824.1 NADH:ubiquinone oxidoreductase subunit 5 (subunit L)/multisubunit Na+/H+ antiporter MnhA subunit [Actinomadura rupiterrae]
MSALAWALPVLPLAAGALLLLAGRRADRIAPLAGVLVALGTLVLAVAAAAQRPKVTFPLFAGLPAGLHVDGLSAVMVLTVASAALAVLVFAAGDIGADEPRARFFGLMLVFAGAMLVTVTASDLAVLLMAWEVMGAMSYALIGFWWHDPERVESANVAFLTTRAGDLGLYFAAGCAVAGTHSLSLGALADAASPWRDLVAAGIVLAAFGKSAQLPFSFWLSRAMAGPSPVSALLHSATMVAAGAYLLIRVHPLLEATGWAEALVAWVGALTALVMGAVAVAQRDLKQLLAASTCAQIGFMVLAAGVGSVAGGAAQLVAHAAVKCLLFLGAGAWLTALGTKDLGELHGAARRFRLVGVTFGAGALALAGLPPLSLWVTKDVVLASAPTPLYAVGLAAGVLAAAYSVKALVAVWRPEDALTRDDTDQRGTRHVGLAELLPMPVLAAIGAGFGIVALPGVLGPWQRLLGASGEHGPTAVELLLSGAIALVVAVAVSRRPVPELRVAANWFYLERAADRLVARPVLAFAEALARFDDRVLDGAVRMVAAGGRAAASVASRRLEFPADGLVDGLGRAVRRLGALARRPQTGQVHTYYAQAAVLLVVLALVVVLVG